MVEDFKLKVFDMVARTGSFTGAARHLGISQPAVSQNIAELEKETGVKLFSRNRGSVALTPEGEAFKVYSDKILQWYRLAGIHFGGASRSSGPDTVRILCSDPVLAPLATDVAALLQAGGRRTKFIIHTYRRESAREYDATLQMRVPSGKLDFEATGSFVGELPCLAFSKTGAPQDDVSGTAVWSPLLEGLDSQGQAQCIFESDDLDSLLDFFFKGDAQEVIAPATALFHPLLAAALGNGSLRQLAKVPSGNGRHIYYVPTASFKGTELSEQFESLLEAKLRSLVV